MKARPLRQVDGQSTMPPSSERTGAHRALEPMSTVEAAAHLTKTGMEGIIATSAAGTLTDVDDAGAPGVRVEVERFHWPRLVPRRPYDQQRSLRPLDHATVVAALHGVPRRAASKPGVVNRRWRFNIEGQYVDAAVLRRMCPVTGAGTNLYDSVRRYGIDGIEPCRARNRECELSCSGVARHAEIASRCYSLLQHLGEWIREHRARHVE